MLNIWLFVQQIEAEKFPDISEEYEIAAVPSFVIVKVNKWNDDKKRESERPL